MATLLVTKPADAAKFDTYYHSTHAPLAKKIPGMRRYEVSTTEVGTPQGESTYHLVAILSFDSLEALKAGLGSPEGQATASDLGNFAQAGVELFMFDTNAI
jgi:uncharacterized protein (TIGR02118 family)